MKIRKPLAGRLTKALNEGIEHAQGKRKLQATTVPVPAGRTYTGRQVAKIRARYGYSQAHFARVLAVNVKTLQSWEQGVRTPSGPTMRLLQMFDRPDDFAELLGAP